MEHYLKKLLVDNILKKIKHLRTTFLEYADGTSIVGHWTDELKEDFEIIDSLETVYSIHQRLPLGDMEFCNKLYRKYNV